MKRITYSTVLLRILAGIALIGVARAEGTAESWRDQLYDTLKSFVGNATTEFDVDHIDEALCQGWSVLVRGTGAPRRAPGGAAPPAGGRRGLAVARRRARGLRADRAP